MRPGHGGQLAQCCAFFNVSQNAGGYHLEAVVFLLFVAAGVGLIFLSLFYWALKRGQFDNIEGPARRMILDDEDDD